MIEFWKNALVELKAGKRVFLAFVADCTKGSPGTQQAKMLVREDGTQFGTVGGGIMELRVLQNALKALRHQSFATRLQTIRHNPQAENASGLICGGSQSNVLTILTPERDTSTVEQILEHARQDSNAYFELSRTGLSVVEARESESSPPVSLSLDGDTWSFKASTLNHRRIAIFGAGHCGQALARQMKWLGYHVTLSDSRDNLLLSESIRDGDTLVPCSPSSTCRAIRHWDKTKAVVMTHSYPTDLDALAAVLPFNPPFLGVMGSPPKLKKIRDELRAIGFEQQQIESIRAPIGLAIGSDTPQEIAVSVAAQIVQENNLSKIHEPTFANHVSA